MTKNKKKHNRSPLIHWSQPHAQLGLHNIVFYRPRDVNLHNKPVTKYCNIALIYLFIYFIGAFCVQFDVQLVQLKNDGNHFHYYFLIYQAFCSIKTEVSTLSSVYLLPVISLSWYSEGSGLASPMNLLTTDRYYWAGSLVTHSYHA